MGMHRGIVWFEGDLDALVEAMLPIVSEYAVRVERTELANLGEWFGTLDRTPGSVVEAFAFVRSSKVAAMVVPNGASLRSEMVASASETLGLVGGATIESAAGAASLWVADRGHLVRTVDWCGDESIDATGAPQKFEPAIGDEFYMNEFDALMRNLGLPPFGEPALEGVGPVISVRVVGQPRTLPKPVSSPAIAKPKPKPMRWAVYVGFFVGVLLLRLLFANRP